MLSLTICNAVIKKFSKSLGAQKCTILKAQIEQKTSVIEETSVRISSREEHLKHKQGELNEILAETEKEEKALIKFKFTVEDVKEQ